MTLVDLIMAAPAWLIERFDSKEKAAAIGYAILLAAAALGGVTWRRHRRFVGPLHQAILSLGRALRPGLTQEAQMAEAGAALSRAGLGIRWAAYHAAIEDSPTRPGQHVSLLPPSDWFALERLPGRGYERWAQTWPGVFLTTGLLFTFIGLAAALLRVGDAGTGGDLLAATGAVLRISSAKFITSIAGLLAYIAWTVGARALQIQQANTAHALADAIQALTTPLSPEALLLCQVRQGQRQSARFDAMATDVALAVDGALAPRFAAMTSSLLAAGDAVTHAVSAIGLELQRVNEATLERMVARLGNDLRLSAGAEMRAVAAALHDAASELAEARNHIAHAGAHASQELTSAAEALRNSATVVDVAVSGAADMAAKTLMSGAETAASNLIAAGRAAGTAMQAAAGHAAGQAAEGLEASAARLAAAMDGSAVRLEHSGGTIAERLDGAGRHIGAAQDALAAHLKQYDGLGLVVSEATTEFGRAAKQLRGVLKPVSAALQQAEQAATASHTVLAQAGTALNALGAAGAALQGAAEASGQAVEQHLTRFGQMDDNLGRAVQALGATLARHQVAAHEEVG